MFGLGWPVLHLPKLFFLKFFDGDEIKLTLFMGKLSKTDRTKDRRLLTVRMKANELDLFIFVLLVHAE